MVQQPSPELTKSRALLLQLAGKIFCRYPLWIWGICKTYCPRYKLGNKLHIKLIILRKISWLGENFYRCISISRSKSAWLLLSHVAVKHLWMWSLAVLVLWLFKDCGIPQKSRVSILATSQAMRDYPWMQNQLTSNPVNCIMNLLDFLCLVSEVCDEMPSHSRQTAFSTYRNINSYSSLFSITVRLPR